MEDFYPSEIARLVLGYLKEKKCETSWKTFLEESSDLQEYSNLFKRGKVYSTNVNGKSLLNILSEYSILKNEAKEKSIQEEYPKIDQSAINKNTLEIAVKNAIDQCFQKDFPALCNQRNDKCDDCVLIFASEKKKSSDNDENVTGGSKNKNNNPSNIQMKSIVSPLPFHPNINKVVSVDDRNFKDINSPREESTLKSSINSSKNEFSEPVCLETIKVEASDDDVTAPVISSTFSYDQENCDLNEVNTGLGNLIKFKTSNCKPLSGSNLEKNRIAQDCSSQNENIMSNSSTVTSESSNSGVQTTSISPVGNMDDFVNASSKLRITSNSFSSELASVSELHRPAVPTYILSNIPPSGSFIHNNIPYQLVVNTAGSELYSTISTVPSNSVCVSTPELKLSEPKISNRTSIAFQASSNPPQVLPKVKPPVASSKSLESACIKDQESAKRKKKNYPFVKKRKSKFDVIVWKTSPSPPPEIKKSKSDKIVLKTASPEKNKTPIITYSKKRNAEFK